MFRQKSAKQTNAQTQGRKPNKQMVENKQKKTNAQTQGRKPNKQMVESARTTFATQAAKSSLSSKGNNAKGNID